MTTSGQDISNQDSSNIEVNGQNYNCISFDRLANKYDINRLPYSAKILLENLLRHQNQAFVQTEDIDALATWNTDNLKPQEIAFVPARVILQDFTGVPAIVDLAAMRNAIEKLGGQAQKINPFNPVELVIDHSIMVDHYASADSMEKNTQVEIERNSERYRFLKWGQKNFDQFKLVPPGRGIVHQVNLEYLARCVFDGEIDGDAWVYPDTLVGTDSHTTMINGLGVLGWGVGGIEAEAAMLGQPVTMLIPEVVGFKLSGKLATGVTATDMVLTITQVLRQQGVVGKFVEFYGPGLHHLTTADRATIANMAPEYGATCGIFPLDSESINYLKLTGRDLHRIALVENYAKQLGIWHDADTPDASYHQVVEFDLASVVPCIAGPKRPQDRIPLNKAAEQFKHWLELRGDLSRAPEEAEFSGEGGQQADIDQQQRTSMGQSLTLKGKSFELEPGAVVIAAITSCTNTSNPSVLIAAGLLAGNARAKGLKSQPWVKTSFAPGSQVVTQYLQDAGLMEELNALGFNLVGYGCTTCIGNSGPLPQAISEAIRAARLPVCSVLSGNRNFEGRIHSDVAANYLASPPLVVAYALAGNMRLDLAQDPLGQDKQGKPVYLKDLWPSEAEVKAVMDKFISSQLFQTNYADVFKGNSSWDGLTVSEQKIYDWPESSYIKLPPFFEQMESNVPPVKDINGARCLVKVGDSITTDHISPAGSIAENSPAGTYLKSLNIELKDFNSYGSRRGNHEVMMRGTFANVRFKNLLAAGTEGSFTHYFPEDKAMSIFDAAINYQKSETPLVILAGKEYGTGSSRDWAAKGPALLGIKAVIAESFERIHRSNLIGMGILPLQFKAGENADSYDLNGAEYFHIDAVKSGQKEVVMKVSDKASDEKTKEISLDIRIDTANEFDYYQNGGILHFVIRKLLADK